MLSKRFRYSFKEDLPKKIINSRSFSVRYEKNDLDRLQAAVVVSKRVDKRATVRNKVKRKILEIVRGKTNLNTPLSLIFYIKKQALESDNLEKEVESVLAKIKQF